MAATFFQRPYPSANSILLRGRRPVLVDTGFGADAPAMLAWLAGQGLHGRDLALIFNTHSHCDHAGGNHLFRYDPFDVTKTAPIVGGDLFHGFQNSKSEDKTFFAR